MSPLHNLPEILTDLQTAAPTLRLADRVAALEALTGQGASEELRDLVQRIRERMGKEARWTRERHLFREAQGFPKQHRNLPRLDEIVEQLFLPPAEQAVMQAALERLPTLSVVNHFVIHMTEPSVLDLFGCPAELQKYLQGRRQGDPLFKPDVLAASTTDEDTMRIALDYLVGTASNLVADWWSARADCVAVAVAELVCALRDDRVSALTVAPNGSEKPLLPKFWRGSDGFEYLFSGFVEQRGETNEPVQAGVYINGRHAVARIREPISAADSRLAAVVEWFKLEVEKSPNEVPMGPNGVQMSMNSYWERAKVEVDEDLEFDTFKTGVWSKVLPKDHPWRRGGRRKKIPRSKTESR